MKTLLSHSIRHSAKNLWTALKNGTPFVNVVRLSVPRNSASDNLLRTDSSSTFLLHSRASSQQYLNVERSLSTQKFRMNLPEEHSEPRADNSKDSNISHSSIGTSSCSTNHNVKPSTHTEHMWLEASSAPCQYEEANGKWLMFFPRDQIDEKWAQVGQLYFSGDLDRISSVTVSTAMPSTRSFAKTDHVVALFCGPADDETRVREIGANLVAQIAPNATAIYYKSNEQTAQSFPTDTPAEGFRVKNGVNGGKNRPSPAAKKSLYRLNIPKTPGHVATFRPDKQLSDNEEPNDDVLASLSVDKSVSCECILERGDCVMVLDTETTGFPPRASPDDLEAWEKCRMVELAWHMYCACGQILAKYAFLVKPDFSFEIPAGAVKVHGITRKKALLEGKPIQSILRTFEKSLEEASVVVGHNIQFDHRVILAEMHRAKHSALAGFFSEVPTDCTMALGAQKMPSGRNLKLAVLYEECFGEEPGGVMHRADADVEACARIYFFLRYGQTIKPEVSDNEEVDAAEVEGTGDELEVTSSSSEDVGFSGTDPESEEYSDVEEKVSDKSEEKFLVGNYETTPTVAALVAIAVGCTVLFFYHFVALVL